MSFDLRIREADIAIGSDGDFEKVEGTNKLIQEVLKILLTRLGSNVFYPWYGSLISQSMVGQALDAEMLNRISANHIQNSLENLQRLQQKQAAQQRVTSFEQLAAIRSVKVTQNRVDFRVFTVAVEIASRALSVSNVQFEVTPGL